MRVSLAAQGAPKGEPSPPLANARKVEGVSTAKLRARTHRLQTNGAGLPLLCLHQVLVQVPLGAQQEPDKERAEQGEESHQRHGAHHER
eukprot:CAMPEP_0181417012 /NCGR_PEP_ID=MMETSP1110-20121109/10821_1 /TAXON_ID=174948 /ORGANISM="Symbiodinium sp., Strain CCMP421" /LENGTH=88 /DNA_ID=CAMNT_0023539949 /DNA_START=187 /DNA_END=449 /DNA_ORIENTATION=-